jgi:hypothetical protein
MSPPQTSLQLRQLSQALAARLGPGEAAEACARAAAALTQAMSLTKEPRALAGLSENLSAVLAGGGQPEHKRRAAALTGGLGRAADGYGLMSCSLLLRPVTEPLPCRLSTPQLVELLKHPLCVNEARRVVLDQLGSRYRRRFADVWEFVRFAREHEPGLDFTSPPQRPALAAAVPK